MRHGFIFVLLLFLGLPNSSWAATKFMESGTDATQGLEFYIARSGGASSTAITMTGPRVIQFGPTTGAENVQAIQTNGSAIWRFKTWFQLNTLPSATIPIISIFTGAPGVNIELRLTSAGVLQIWENQGGAQLGSNGSTLSINTTYRLTLTLNLTSTSVWTVKSYVNEALDISVSNTPTLTANTNASNAYFGLLAAQANTITAYIDNVYIDDVGDNTDPGDIRITAKLPASNNVNNFSTAIGANPANRWTNVNERPLSETNGWEDLVLADRENFGIEAASVGDVDISAATLVARSAWLWGKATTGGLGTPALIDNGSDIAITLTSTSKLFTNITDSSTYPTNAATIGMLGAGVSDNTFLYECGMLIAYTPAAGGGGAGGPVGYRNLLGVGQ